MPVPEHLEHFWCWTWSQTKSQVLDVFDTGNHWYSHLLIHDSTKIQECLMNCTLKLLQCFDRHFLSFYHESYQCCQHNYLSHQNRFDSCHVWTQNIYHIVFFKDKYYKHKSWGKLIKWNNWIKSNFYRRDWHQGNIF